MTSLEHLGYRQEFQRALTFRDLVWLTHLAMPLAGLAVIGYVLYEMDSAAKIMGAVWIALGVMYFAVHTIILKKPAAIDL